MNLGQTVFSQLLQHLPHKQFQKCVARYGGDSYVKSLSCWDQFLAMVFAQLTYRESLRDIEACLRSIGGKRYHMGFRSTIARSTLADANESRDWRIYADFAQTLIAIARPLYAHDPIGVELQESLYALDSTTIDLCISLFPWAKFRQHKAAVKVHTLLDLHGNIPSFIRITAGKTSDVNILDEFLPEAGAFYVFDRGYIDFARLFVFTLCSAFFVVRTKENVLLQRRYSHPVDKSTGVRSDHTVILTTIESTKAYPDPLRRVSYLDVENRRRLKFLTNGTSDNAVKTQIWIAVSVYVLVAIVRKRLGLDMSLYQILQIFSITLLEKMPILSVLEAFDSRSHLLDNPNQLILFDF
jgi:Domain of unknown function (DUF4372)/Transposase DDE domain